MVLKQVLSDLTVDFPPLELLLSCKTPCDVNVLVSIGEGERTDNTGSRQNVLWQIFKPTNLNSVKIHKAVPLQTLGKANWFPAVWAPASSCPKAACCAWLCCSQRHLVFESLCIKHVAELFPLILYDVLEDSDQCTFNSVPSPPPTDPSWLS